MLGYVPIISGNWWHSLFQKILLFLDSVVYWAVSMCYQLFVKLATFRLFDDSFFSEFANRIYSILGVFMLFYLAYALLNALINPEKLTGDKGVSKIASNLVISLILLGLIPTIFDYAYRLQNYVLSSNIIGAIILGTSPTDPQSTSDSEGNADESMIKFGDSLAFTVLNTFVNPDNYNVKASNTYTWYDFKIEVLEESTYSNLSSFSDATVGEQVDLETGEEVVIKYYGFISTFAGCFLIYVILSFTLDLGVRVIKLAFCQLIAPIPIIMRVMPSKKSTFDKWVKTTLSVFFEVFVRVALMYIAVYFIQAIWEYDIFKNFGGILGKLALVVIILGIFAFVKQAPKMISDMLGIESGNLKLGIGEKLKASGFLGQGIYSVGQRTLGAVTGSLGAGISGLANGAGTSGFLFGMANGWKNKGLQFGKQKQDMYSKLTGDYRGKVGWFGKEAISNQAYKYMTGLPTAIASRSRQEEIEAFEKDYINAEKSRKKQEFEEHKKQELQQIRELFNEKQRLFENNKQKELNSLKEQQIEEQNAFEQKKSQTIARLQREMSPEFYMPGVSRSKSQIQKELDEVMSSSYSNEQLQNKISSLMSSRFADSSEGQELTKQLSEIQKKAYEMSADEEKKIRADLVQKYGKELDKLDKDYIEHRQQKEALLIDKASKKYHANLVNADRLGEEKRKKDFQNNIEEMMKEYGYKKEDKK